MYYISSVHILYIICIYVYVHTYILCETIKKKIGVFFKKLKCFSVSLIQKWHFYLRTHWPESVRFIICMILISLGTEGSKPSSSFLGSCVSLEKWLFSFNDSKLQKNLCRCIVLANPVAWFFPSLSVCQPSTRKMFSPPILPPHHPSILKYPGGRRQDGSEMYLLPHIVGD